MRLKTTCRRIDPCDNSRPLKGPLILLGVIAAVAIAPAQAQWAVVDAPAIVQLIQEVQTMQQQLATARNQLLQAQQALQTMTGNRGMQLLLSGTNRNYLPSNWVQVTGALQAPGGYAGLNSDVQAAVNANAVLSPQRVASLPATTQQQLQTSRQWDAMQQALSHEALANVSSRFAAIQTLIAAISTAADQKGILDLQARISAEVGMLQNEQTKMQVLYQATQAQESVMHEQSQEYAIAAHGQFQTRFQPTP